jgi:hypothetical protein
MIIRRSRRLHKLSQTQKLKALFGNHQLHPVFDVRLIDAWLPISKELVINLQGFGD